MNKSYFASVFRLKTKLCCIVLLALFIIYKVLFFYWYDWPEGGCLTVCLGSGSYGQSAMVEGRSYRKNAHEDLYC